MNINSIKLSIKKHAPSWALDMFYRMKYRELPNSKFMISLLAKKNGIEIGGPSDIFKYSIPVYREILNLDGVNFSNSTMWEGALKAGPYFRYLKGRTGTQFIKDATDLCGIESGTYDFLISSNCLEHVANPLKALEEWIRVVKSSGILLIILPNKANSFDHRRETTTFEHLTNDYKVNMLENDLTHLDEILKLHDLSFDPEAGNFEKFKERCLENFVNRGLHHHVFDLDVMRKMLEFFGAEIIFTDSTSTDHIVIAKVNK